MTFYGKDFLAAIPYAALQGCLLSWQDKTWTTNKLHQREDALAELRDEFAQRCVHCHLRVDDHVPVQGKCLFDATSFAPITALSEV